MMRTLDEMINMMTPGDNCIPVNLSSTDYTVAAGVTVKGISSVGGSVVVVDIKNAVGTTISSVQLPANFIGVRGITKIYKSGTDATGLVLWID